MNDTEMQRRIEIAKRRYEERVKARKFTARPSTGVQLGEVFVLYAKSDGGKSCFYSDTENTE